MATIALEETADTITTGVGDVVTVSASVDTGVRPVFYSPDNGRRLAADVDDLGIWTASWATSRDGDFAIRIEAAEAAPVVVLVTVTGDGPPAPDYFGVPLLDQAYGARDSAVAARNAALGHRTAAQNARTGAEAARDTAQALVLLDLETSDGQMAALVAIPASETAQALKTPPSPEARAVDAASNTLLGGGTSPGKRVLSGTTGAGKMVLEVATEQAPNGYTSLNIFPSTESSRSSVSVWAKSPDDLSVGEKNALLWSMQGHSVAEEGVSHATMYAHMKEGMTTQNGRQTISAGGPLQAYQGHIFQFATEDQFDNRFELLTFLQARGLMPVDLWSGAAGAYAGISDEAGSYATFMLAGGDAAKVALIQNRNGVLSLTTGASGSMKITTPGGLTFAGSQFYLDDTTQGIRVRGVLPTTDGQPGVWAGRVATDQSQPALRLANGTAGQEAGWDNRLGVLRTIVGGTVRMQANNGGIAFNGSAPIAKPALPAAATDAATTQALANAIRSALISYGLTT